MDSVCTLEEESPPERVDDGVVLIEINDSTEEDVMQVQAEVGCHGSPHTPDSSIMMEAAELLQASPTCDVKCERCGKDVISKSELIKHVEETHKNIFKKVLKPRKTKTLLKAKKQTMIVLNEVDSVSETSEDDTENEADNETENGSETSEDETENETENKAENETGNADRTSVADETVNTATEDQTKVQRSSPPPAMWASTVPELPLTWDFRGGSLPSSFLEKALAGVAKNSVLIPPASHSSTTSQTPIDSPISTTPTPTVTSNQPEHDCLVFLGRERFMGEIRRQGDRLGRMEEKEQKMENMLVALQMRVEDVLTKLNSQPSPPNQPGPRPEPQQELSQEQGAVGGAVGGVGTAANTASTTHAPLLNTASTPTTAASAAPASAAPVSATPAANPTPATRRVRGAHPEWSKCNDCEYETRSLKRLDNHVATHHTRPHHFSKTVDTFLLVGDSTLGSLRGKVRQ